jgi:hypothetical protein
VQQVQWDLDGGERTGSGANNTTVQINDDRDHVLKTRAYDGQFWSAWKTQHVKIDTLVPTDVTSVPSGWRTAALPVDVAGADATSGVAQVEWTLTGPTSSSGTATTNPKTITVSGDGTWTLNTRVTDNAGLTSGWKTKTILMDTTAPANLTPTAPATWMSSPYSVYVSGSDGGSGLSEMRWSIDGAPPQSGPPGTAVTVSGTGTHHLVTWAVDVAGNASGQRDDVVKIDTLPPTDTTSVPSTIGNHGTVPVTGTDLHSGIEHVEWKLDAGDEFSGSGASGTNATIVGTGAHTLWTRVFDAAGNATAWKSSPITVDVSGDTTPPTDTSTSAGTSWYTDQSVSFTVAATDASSGVEVVQWRIGTAIQSSGSSATVTITGEGPHYIETRARDVAGNYSAWRGQWVRIDSVQPVDTSSIPHGWTKTNAFTLSGTDGTSGMASMEYMVDGAAASSVANGTAIPALADGDHTIVHRAVVAAGQASDWITDTVKIDTVNPANTSPAAPTGWQKHVTLALTGTDLSAGFDHGEWRIDGGSWQPGPVDVTADGTHTLDTRAVDAAGNTSATRSETIKVDATAPANTTAAPSAAWLRDTFTATLAGTDGGSGVTQREWTLDGVAQTGTAISVAAAGAHVLRTRVGDAAGNWSDWREDDFGIDRTAPALGVKCSSGAWSAAAVGCTVAGDGGESGLATLTVARNGGAAGAVASGAAYTVADDGDWTLTIAGTDKAGNTASTTAHVRVDHTAPTAGLSCAADTGTAYICRASGADATSGLASLTYSVNGGAAATPAAGGSFKVAQGRVVVRAVDAAGNAANSVALILSDRVVPYAPTPRTVSEAVLRSGRGSVLARALGEIALTSTADKTSVDLRPLALGKGSFRITMKLRADKQRKTYTKTVKARKGYTPRISVRMAAAARVTVDLTVRHKVGKRWKAFASGGAELG